MLVPAEAGIGGAAVVIEVTSAPQSSETIYLLHDHLGSTDVITGALGNVQTRYAPGQAVTALLHDNAAENRDRLKLVLIGSPCGIVSWGFQKASKWIGIG